ncbi:MAG: hypothetical protein ACYC40_01445 [Patescibacteria group bacterium]
MEGFFKFLFGLSIFVAALVVIGIFLLIVKILLMFYPSVHVMGLILSY